MAAGLESRLHHGDTETRRRNNGRELWRDWLANANGKMAVCPKRLQQSNLDLYSSSVPQCLRGELGV